jgi:4-diphosphocytidyl-2-C-methyl-D-erythritol kinase
MMSELARAKVNLALHVTGRRADGYHLLDSIVVFPELGDHLEAEPARGLSLTIDGPFGRDLDAGPSNLVMRAAALFGAGQGAALRLTKSLPIASGIGGGSADAAAALRLLARLWGVSLPSAAAVLGIGADLPVCLVGESCRMQGIGEALTPFALPSFAIVLVNPGVPVPTGAVFSGLASHDNEGLGELPRGTDPGLLFDWLARQRNDLEAPAVAIAPPIGRMLAALKGQDGCRLARMSGSGATCFGLFATLPAALAAADTLRAAQPEWWIAAAPAGGDGAARSRV